MLQAEHPTRVRLMADVSRVQVQKQESKDDPAIFLRRGLSN